MKTKELSSFKFILLHFSRSQRVEGERKLGEEKVFLTWKAEKYLLTSIILILTMLRC